MDWNLQNHEPKGTFPLYNLTVLVFVTVTNGRLIQLLPEMARMYLSQVSASGPSGDKGYRTRDLSEQSQILKEIRADSYPSCSSKESG